MVTAGLIWQPEIWPKAYTIVTTVRPKAKAIPKTPMPSWGIPALRSALPQPAKTNQKVPSASAANRCPIVPPPYVSCSPHYARPCKKVQAVHGPAGGRGLASGTEWGRIPPRTGPHGSGGGPEHEEVSRQTECPPELGCV